MAYSTDLREKVLDYYGQCNNISQVASVYGVSRHTLYRWIHLREQTGSLKHRVKGQNAAKLNMSKLAQYVQQHPDAYLYESACEFDCTASAVLYALRRLGIARKKDRHIPRARPKQSKALHATVGQTDSSFGLPNGLFG